jgi:hypothetical protein
MCNRPGEVQDAEPVILQDLISWLQLIKPSPWSNYGHFTVLVAKRDEGIIIIQVFGGI